MNTMRIIEKYNENISQKYVLCEIVQTNHGGFEGIWLVSRDASDSSSKSNLGC
jgi:hypothetical protein